MILSNVSLDIIIFLQGLRNGFTDLFFNAISMLGEEYFYILVLGSIYWVYNKRFGEVLGVTLGASFALNNVLKGIFNMPRPFQEFPNEVENLRGYTATGSAFPSGHVQGISSFLFAIYFYLKQRLFLIVAIVFTLLMMISRMYLGVHYIEDVIIGGVIGLLLALVISIFFNKYKDNDHELHRFYSIIVLVFLPGLFLLEVNDFFKGYGILVGVILGVVFEKHNVQFSLEIPPLKKVIRVVVGLVFMGLTLTLLKPLFGLLGATEGTWGANILDFVRYFLVAFVGIGLYPLFFKRFKF